MQGKYFIRPLLAGLLTISSLGTASIAMANISTAQSTDGIVAVVNDKVILKSELVAATAALSAEYRANHINATPSQIQHMALDGLINHKLQLGMIERLGVVPNDGIINAQMLQIAHGQGLQSLTQLQSTLDAQQKGSYAALRNQLIENAAIAALWQHQASERIRITDQQIKAFLNSPEAKSILQPQYHLIHIRVPYQANPSQSDMTQAQQVANQVATALQNGDSLNAILNNIKDYQPQIQGADTGFISQSALPSDLAQKIAQLPTGGLTYVSTPQGIDVVKLVEKNEQGHVLIPEWRTSHILVRVDGTQNNAMAEQKINALYHELQKGANFAQLAATYSDDAGSAQQRGSLGWVSEGQMVPEFEAMMKNTSKGDYSTPFRSQFGWHILKVDDIRKQDVTEQYRTNIAREMIFNRMAPQAQEDWIEQMRAAAHIEIFNE